MLEFKDVDISGWDGPVIGHLSFTLGGDESLYVQGGKGAGKTLLVSTLLGYHTAEKGYVTICGELVTPASAPYFRRMMTYIPQNLDLPYDKVSDMIDSVVKLRVNRGRQFSVEEMVKYWSRLGVDESLYDLHYSRITREAKQLIMLSIADQLSKPILVVDDVSSALIARAIQQFSDNGVSCVVTGRDSALADTFDKAIRLSQENEKE